MANSPIRLLFLIRQLDIGGAERQLLNLVSGLDPARFDVHVASMYDGGGLVPLFAAVPHVTMHSLAKAGRWDVRAFLGRLRQLARTIRPHIVHGYMGGANELALLAARAAGARCIWGIRVSDLNGGQYTWSVHALFRLGALLSRSVDLQIANSERGRSYHVAAGYRSSNFVVVPNGIDVNRFAPVSDARAAWRSQHEVPADRPLLVMPARLDPMKDHDTFLRALRRLRADREFTAVCLGSGPTALRDSYVSRAAELGLGDCVRFVEARTDVTTTYAAADVIVLSSAYGEGFPNVIGEAMACGRICVATDVGDAGVVLNDDSRLVRPGDDKAMADALLRVLALTPDEASALETAARARIVEEFSIAALVMRSSMLFDRLARG